MCAALEEELCTYMSAYLSEIFINTKNIWEINKQLCVCKCVCGEGVRGRLLIFSGLPGIYLILYLMNFELDIFTPKCLATIIYNIDKVICM